MKSFTIIILVHLLAISLVYADTPGPVCQKGSDCEVVKTYTKCDVDKQKLNSKIAKLEQELKELKAQVPKTYYFPVVEEKTIINKHIVSVVAHETLKSVESSVSGNTAIGTVTTNYVPAITYQYQFDSGIVPLIGLDIKSKPNLMFGVGYEF